MAKLEGRPTLKLDLSLTLSESEARALYALSGYDADGFLNVFYEKFGRAYLEPHAGGLHSLFESVRDQLPNILARMKKARDVFNGAS